MSFNSRMRVWAELEAISTSLFWTGFSGECSRSCSLSSMPFIGVRISCAHGSRENRAWPGWRPRPGLSLAERGEKFFVLGNQPRQPQEVGRVELGGVEQKHREGDGDEDEGPSAGFTHRGEAGRQRSEGGHDVNPIAPRHGGERAGCAGIQDARMKISRSRGRICGFSKYSHSARPQMNTATATR